MKLLYLDCFAGINGDCEFINALSSGQAQS